MKDKILEFEEIFRQNIHCMYEMTVLYHLWCHENYSKLNIEEKEKILNFTYNIYLDDEGHYDIGTIADTIMENYKDVLNGKMDKYNFYAYI